MKDISELISSLTIEEKAALLAGTDFMFTNPVPRKDIPQVRMSDGPHGLRVQKEGGDNGVTGSEPATAFPTAVTTASSWNPENTRKMGEAIGEECNAYGVNILLGPGVNIKRNPLCGRNFEYFSEDPFLASEMAIAEVQGVQSRGAGACIKHFALNNLENFRFMGNSVADERAIRELYLKVFERVVKKAKPSAVMCAYNQINSTFCSENKWLLTDVLRDEWGFDGIVMTDWGAIKDRVKAVSAQLDLEMPGDTAACRKALVDAVKDGTLSMEDFDRCVKNVLSFVEKYSSSKDEKANFDEHHALAAEIAEDSAVLMKNDGVLPLKKKKNRFLVVGELFDKMRYQGSGSSMISPARLTTIRQAFDDNGVEYEFVRGYRVSPLTSDEELIQEAVKKAEEYSTVLVFAGLTDFVESEGGDRENMRLPEKQLQLIDRLCGTGKTVVVVLFGGSVVELPFADRVNGILNMFLPGQNGGTATYRLLFGEKNPSGRLSETWWKSYSDVPFGKDYSTQINEVYRESIFVGYRYALTAQKQVAFPFGYGLSYTKFSYTEGNVEDAGKHIYVSCTVKNVGRREGAEVVQVYVKAPSSDVFKPTRELRGFQKVYLKAGESKRIVITIDKEDLRYFNVKEKSWVMECGLYEVQICSDCNTVRLSYNIALEGERVASPYSEEVNEIYQSVALDQMTDKVFGEMSGIDVPPLPPKRPITMESPIAEFATSAILGKMLYKILVGVGEGQVKKAKKMPDGAEKDNKIKGGEFLIKIMNTNSPRSLSMSAGKSLPLNVAQGFVDFANGHVFKGIGSFCSSIKAPKLPKEEK